jgi:MFS family permease
LNTTTLYSIVQVIGAPLAGLVYDRLGAYWLYVFAVFAQIMAIVILWFVFPARSETLISGETAI